MDGDLQNHDKIRDKTHDYPVGSNDPFVFTLINDLKRDVKLNWINFLGNKQFQSNIKPNEVYSQKSFKGHKWELENDRKIFSFQLGFKREFLNSGVYVQMSKLNRNMKEGI